MLTDGSYRRHVEQLRTRLSDAMGLTLQRVRALGLRPFIEPKSGPFLWARLPGGRDAAEVARFGLTQDVIFAPGNVFSVSHTAKSDMRFNVANCAHPRVFDVLGRAIEMTAPA